MRGTGLPLNISGSLERHRRVDWFVGGPDPVFASAPKAGTVDELAVNHLPDFATLAASLSD